ELLELLARLPDDVEELSAHRAERPVALRAFERLQHRLEGPAYEAERGTIAARLGGRDGAFEVRQLASDLLEQRIAARLPGHGAGGVDAGAESEHAARLLLLAADARLAGVAGVRVRVVAGQRRGRTVVRRRADEVADRDRRVRDRHRRRGPRAQDAHRVVTA